MAGFLVGRGPTKHNVWEKLNFNLGVKSLYSGSLGEFGIAGWLFHHGRHKPSTNFFPALG